MRDLRLVSVGLAVIPALLGAAEVRAFPADDAPVNATANCFTLLNGDYVLPVTHQIAWQGDDVSVQLGINANYGGLGVQLQLGNRHVPGAIVDVLEGRASTANGLQFEYAFKQGDGQVFGFRQGAGNAGGLPWGYSVGYAQGTGYTLDAQDWIPLFNDSYDGQATSPCPGRTGPYPVSIDDGATDWRMVPTGTNNGTATILIGRFYLRSKYNQYWWGSGQAWQARSALHLSRRVAADNNLRFYVGRRGTPFAGPYYVYRDGEIVRLVRENGAVATIGQTAAGPADGTDRDKNEIALLGDAAGREAAFVWTIGGQDTVLLVDLPSGGTIAKTANAFPQLPACPSGTADAACGGLSWWTNLINSPESYTAPAGGQRLASAGFVIGSRAQMATVGVILP